MKVTLLGVGGSAGLPQIGGPNGLGDWGKADPAEPRNRRTRSSIVIESPENKRILVDTAPDLRPQLLACGIGRIDSLIYTHAHADHIAGFDEIRILNRLLCAPLPAYTDARTWAELRQRFDYAFRPFEGGLFYRPVLHPHTIAPGDIVEIQGLPVQFIGQDHGTMPSLGLRVNNLAYCTDVVRLDETALTALENLDVLVIGCFTPGPSHPTHANLATVLGWVARLRPRRTVLTHLGPEMDYQHLRATLPAGVEPGYDGMVIQA